jgi:hypothetical protein
MKKSLSIIAIAALGTGLFVACGPSDKEKREKATQDSLAQVAKNDSIEKATAAAMNVPTDSTKTDSAAAPATTATEEKK